MPYLLERPQFKEKRNGFSQVCKVKVIRWVEGKYVYYINQGS